MLGDDANIPEKLWPRLPGECRNASTHARTRMQQLASGYSRLHDDGEEDTYGGGAKNTHTHPNSCCCSMARCASKTFKCIHNIMAVDKIGLYASARAMMMATTTPGRRRDATRRCQLPVGSSRCQACVAPSQALYYLCVRALCVYV